MAVKKIETLNKHENPATNENQFDIENYMNVNWDKIKEVVDNNADELTTTQEKVTTLETDNTKNKQDIANKVDKVDGKGLSTNDFTNEEKEKLAGLNNYDDTEIKQDIQELQTDVSDIKAEQEVQNDLLQRTQSALINITTEKSSNINVKDSSDLNAKVDVYGISKQETREGYNLLNVSEELEISIFKEITVDLKANSTYTLKFENAIAGADNNQSLITFRNTADVISRIIDTSTTKKITVQPEQEITNIRIYASTDYTSSTGKTKTFEKLMIYEGTEDKDYEQYGASPSPEFPSKIENVGDNINLFNKETVGNNTYIDASNGQVQSYTGSSSSDYINVKNLKSVILSGDTITRDNGGAFYNSEKVYISGFTTNQIWSGIDIPETANYVRVTVTTANLDKIKLEKGKKATSYSSYKCGSIDITVYNKNTFDMQKFKDFYSLTETGVDDGYDYVAYTTKVYENSRFMQGEFKANTQYTISFLGRQKQVGQGQTSGFIFNYTDGTSSIKYVNNDVTWTEYTLTSDKNKTIDYISMAWAYGGTIWLSDIQLEENNVATEYVEHEEQLITFPLSEGQKLMDRDKFEDNGIHHVRKQMELDGTENWQLTARDEYYAFWLAYNEIGMIDRYNKKICTHFSYYSQIFTEAPVNSICENSGSPNMIIFKVDFCTTIEAFKTYLAQQKQAGTPVIVEYELATEEIEPYTPEQQEAYNKLQNVLAYKPVTNIFTDKALLEFKYIADTQTWVVNEIKLLKEQISTINQLLSTTNTSALLLDNMQTDLESEVV